MRSEASITSLSAVPQEKPTSGEKDVRLDRAMGDYRSNAEDAWVSGFPSWTIINSILISSFFVLLFYYRMDCDYNVCHKSTNTRTFFFLVCQLLCGKESYSTECTPTDTLGRSTREMGPGSLAWFVYGVTKYIQWSDTTETREQSPRTVDIPRAPSYCLDATKMKLLYLQENGATWTPPDAHLSYGVCN